jgi:hypothetical protein
MKLGSKVKVMYFCQSPIAKSIQFCFYASRLTFFNVLPPIAKTTYLPYFTTYNGIPSL